MKRLLFGIAGIMMALAVVIGAPGMAGATPIAAYETIGFGPSTTATGTDTVTVTPRLSYGSPVLWTLQGWDAAGNEIGDVSVSNGELVFNNLTNQVEFTGQIVGSSASFDVLGALSNYSGPSASNHYYTWNVVFSNLSSLSNAVFTASGAYVGSVSIEQTGKSLYTGNSAANLDVSSVPLPSALLLFAPGLFGLIGMRKRLHG